MKIAKYKRLKLGLYKIYWKSGGSSLASIGMLPNGDRWIAPINWVRPSEDQKICNDIKSMVLVEPKQNIIKKCSGWLRHRRS